MGEDPSDREDVAAIIAEFVPLNRRRLHGEPPLGVEELERWGFLRDLLEHHVGTSRGSAAPGVVERSLRLPTHLKVRYHPGSGSATSANVSEGGIFIETARPLPPGTPLRLEIEPIGEGDHIETDATVMWNREIGNLDGPAGMGVAFENLDGPTSDSVVRLMDRLLAGLAERHGGRQS